MTIRTLSTTPKSNCNRCSPVRLCPKQFNDRFCKSLAIVCKNFRAPKESWKLSELALAHTKTFVEAFSTLPFTFNLEKYLK